MRGRPSRLIYLALIPAIAATMLSGLPHDGLYHRVSDLLLTTASMEAATARGAIGEPLPEP